MFTGTIAKIKIYLSSGHERSVLAKKNALISFLIKGFSILISLLLVSISIKLVSAEEYGIWLTLSSIIGWFSFFDVGLGHGLKNKLSEANAKGNFEDAKLYISTTYALIFGISVVLAVLFFIVNFFLDWNDILNTNSTDDFKLIAFLVFASFCLQLTLQLIYAILTALHKVAFVSILSFSAQLISFISIILLKYYSMGTLLNLVLAFIIPPLVVQSFATATLFKGIYKNISPSIQFVKRKFSKELLNVGWMFFLIQIGALMLFQTDNIIIIHLFDANMVTSFNVTYKLFSVVSMFFTVLMTPFWTAFTDAYAQKDMIWIEKIMRKLNSSIFIIIGISVILLLASPYIFDLWLTEDVNTWISLSVCMAIYTVVVCWMTVQCYFLNGLGKIKLQFYLYIFATAINIPLAIFLGGLVGINGVLYSNIILVLVISVILHMQAKKVISNTAQGIWLK
jgi:O-antigen/teichoic acid export membrane protein